MKSLRLGALQWGDKVFDECEIVPRKLPGYESYNQLFNYNHINFWGLECMDKRLRASIYHILDEDYFNKRQVYTLSKKDIVFEVSWTSNDLLYTKYNHCVQVSTSFLSEVLYSTIGDDEYLLKAIKTNFSYLYNAMVRKFGKHSVSRVLFICDPAAFGNKYAKKSGIPTVVTGYYLDSKNPYMLSNSSESITVIIYSSLRSISSEKSMYNEFTFEGMNRNRDKSYL